MENELIITREFIKTNYPIENIVNIFNECFPNGAKLSEFPKIRPYLEKYNPNFKAIYSCFAGWLLKVLPVNETPLELDSTNMQDAIIYNGNINIKSDVTLVNPQIYLTGTLKINGKLAVSGNGFISSYENGCVIADEINLSGYTFISASARSKIINMHNESTIIDSVTANSINLYDNALINNSVKVNILNFYGGGRISSIVDADEIYNNGGLIGGDVNTIKIENINGGRVAGKITYKRSDEHK